MQKCLLIKAPVATITVGRKIRITIIKDRKKKQKEIQIMNFMHGSKIPGSKGMVAVFHLSFPSNYCGDHRADPYMPSFLPSFLPFLFSSPVI
jgi:hypothetical protein